MKNTFLFLILITIFTSCKTDSKPSGFVLNGIARNVPDKTVVYLNINNKVVDSSLVENEKFNFKGNVEEPTNALLMVKNKNDYKFIWLENNIIEFNGEKGNFKNSSIKGSLVQKDDDRLKKKLKPIEKKRDSLNLLLSELDGSNENSEKLFTEFNETMAQSALINQNFIKENPNSVVSLHILNIYKTTWGKSTTKELFALLSDEKKQSKKGNLVSKYIEIYGNPKIGEKYIDFEQKNVNGEMIKISNVLNDYTLIEFWASWCGPCRQSNPELVELYNDYNDKGFEIIGVSLDDDKNRWTKAIEKDKLNWTNISDLKGNENEGALRYGVNGIPDNILIDKDGIIIARRVTASILRKSFEAKFGEKASR